MSEFDIPAFLKSLTQRAGVYRMYDDADTLIYVGKARNLKKRVSSYFRARGLNTKTVALVTRIDHIDVTVTSSEAEALILEQTLIKQHRPQYNILLKDDKSYPYLHLSNHPYPLLAYRRGKGRKAGQYYGPFPNSA
ncbi:MAG: GIY-YIG nuclease family protein, partial [Oleibacter sp.]|nr:GIY-YIG nuclease family protein [Thalassolituus sp.]